MKFSLRRFASFTLCAIVLLTSQILVGTANTAAAGELVPPQGFKYVSLFPYKESPTEVPPCREEGQTVEFHKNTPHYSEAPPLLYDKYQSRTYMSRQVGVCVPRYTPNEYKYTKAYCPVGSNKRTIYAGTAGNQYTYYLCEFDNFCPTGQTRNTVTGTCAIPKKDMGPPQQCAANLNNQINVATGNKSEKETDREATPRSGLTFARNYNYYHVLGETPSTMGTNWTHTYQRSIKLDPATKLSAEASRADGKVYRFVLMTENSGPSFNTAEYGKSAWLPDTDVKDRLERTPAGSDFPNGWIYKPTDNTAETYDSTGRLVEITNVSGVTQHLSYDANGLLERVETDFGEHLVFAHNSEGKISSVTDHAGLTWQYQYDVSGNLETVQNPDTTIKIYHYEDASFPSALTGITDERGIRYATYGYDIQGRASLTTYANNTRRIDIRYNENGTRTVTDANGEVSTYATTTQQGSMRVTGIAGAGCSSCEAGESAYSYDPDTNNLLSKIVKGVQTDYGDYDLRGNAGYRIEAVGTTKARTITTEWHPQYNLPVSIARPSVAPGKLAITDISYSDSEHPKLPTRIVRNGFKPDGSAVAERGISLQYNSDGRVTQIDGPRSDVSDITTMTYYPNEVGQGNKRGHLKTVKNALGHTVTYDDYNAYGKVLQMTDANGTATHYVYDVRQRLVSMSVTPVQGEVRTTTYTYDGVGQLLSTTTPDGIHLTYVYDDARHLRSVTNNLGNRIEYVYDLKGNRTEDYTRDPDGLLVRLVETIYDNRDRISSVNTAGSLTSIVYDAVGNLASATDPNLNTTTNNYDPLNRLMQSVDALSGVTYYDYDVNDRVISITAPNSAQTTYTYDDLGNLLKEISPDRGERNYTYNAAGNLVSLIDARSITVNYNYDALGRVNEIDYPGTAEDVSFVYDAVTGCSNGVGRLCRMNDESGVTNYAYDAFSNIAKQTKTELGISYTTQYDYDAGDNVTNTTYPTGRIISANRDSISRVISVSATVSGTQQPIVSDIQYRADNLKTAQTFGNGISESRRYDLQGRLLEQGEIANVASELPDNLTISVTSSIASPVPAGSSIVFTATPSISHIYEYEFSVSATSNGGVITVVQPFSSLNNWTWNSVQLDEGDSIITVRARIAGDVTGSTVTGTLNYSLAGTSYLNILSTFNNNLDDFAVIDDGTSDGGVSAWQVTADGGVIQTTNIHTLNSTGIAREGTYLLHSDPESLNWEDYRFNVKLRSDDNDDIGVMFRYKDTDNYYRFSWNTQSGFRRVVKKVDGVFTVLAEDNIPYITGKDYRVEIIAQSDLLQVLVDDLHIFSMQDSSVLTGSIALYSNGNVGSYFNDISVISLVDGNRVPHIESILSTTKIIGTTEPSQLVINALSPVGNNDALNYKWSVLSGVGSFNDTEIANPTFTSPENTWPQNIVINVAVSLDGNTINKTVPLVYRKILLKEDFSLGTYAGWSVTDQGRYNRPSAWSVANGELRQLSNIYNPSSVGISKYGTYLRYINGASWSDYHLRYNMRSSDNDMLGVMFRMVDSKNFYRFSWDSQRKYRVLVRSVNGVFTQLARDSAPYTINKNYTIDIVSVAEKIVVKVNNKTIFSVVDRNHKKGTIAFYTWANNRTYFDDVNVYDLTAEIPVASSQLNQENITLNKDYYLPVSTPHKREDNSLLLIRKQSNDEKTKGYQYWLYNASTGYEWRMLDGKSMLANITPAKIVYTDDNYLDSWTRVKGKTLIYRYQRIVLRKPESNQSIGFIKVALGNDKSLSTRGYNYDANGNVLNIETQAGIHAYAYDALDRITNDALPNASEIEFDYDANGNRTSDIQGALLNNYGFAAGSNSLNDVNGQTISRDATGNTLADISPLTGGVRNFEYNNANRLFKVYEQGALVATYTYNALGQRTRKVSTTGTTVYHYDLQGQLIAETESDGRPIRDVIWQGIEPVAQINVDGATETLTYLHTDHLATPRSGTDTSGNVVWTWNSDAFGSTPTSGSVTVNLRFPGQYYDSETQLHYNWNRYYDPRIGRYITSDPIGLDGGPNTYAYVSGNPVKITDPEGLVGGCPSNMRPGAGNICVPNTGADPLDSACNNINCVTGMPLPQTTSKTQCEVDKGQCKLTCMLSTIPIGGAATKILDGGIVAGGAILAERKSVCELLCGIEHGF